MIILEIYEDALKKIAEMDAERDSVEGYNEWGEADCFNQARELAQRTLVRAGKSYHSPEN
jgi:hypothetical protein